MSKRDDTPSTLFDDVQADQRAYQRGRADQLREDEQELWMERGVTRYLERQLEQERRHITEGPRRHLRAVND